MVDTTPLYRVPPGVTTRWASPENPAAVKGQGGQANAGRKGAACFPLEAGAHYILAQEAGGCGIVRRIWMTFAGRTPAALRSLRIACYWDGAATPAVSAPLGDFFGTALGRMVPFQSALFANPEGRSFNGLMPMPFRHGMKIVLSNEGDTKIDSVFYDVDYTLGDALPDDALYFHAHFRRENPTALQQDYEILPTVRGRGRFLGVNLGVRANMPLYATSWWGEGEVKIYLDGDATWPTLCGTGTEDYIGTAWGQGQYAHLYQGCHVADAEQMQYCFYRYHIPDPIYFQRDVRVTIQQIGCWTPESKQAVHDTGPVCKAGPGRVPLDLSPAGGLPDYGLFERADDWCSCAYFYLDTPQNELPPLAPVAARLP
jgi:hypothetical protein